MVHDLAQYDDDFDDLRHSLLSELLHVIKDIRGKRLCGEVDELRSGSHIDAKT